MELFKLASIHIAFFCMLGCQSSLPEDIIFYKMRLDSQLPIDSMLVAPNSDGAIVALPDFRAGEASDPDTLIYNFNNCRFALPILEKIEKKNNCVEILPFFTERATVLGKKTITYASKDYEVVKVFYETGDSYLNSSTVFIVDELGVIVVRENSTSYWKKVCHDKSISGLIEKIVQDSTFSEIYPIPLPPPMPDR